jgi:hypothetical protein
MRDPLSDSTWPSLLQQYDLRCRGFDAHSVHLAKFGTDPPNSDRELYYRLIASCTLARRIEDADPAGTYEALLYWKYYSQGTADHNIAMLGTPGSDARRRFATELRDAVASLPKTLDRNVDSVIDLIRQLSKHSIPCMSNTALPTKTTFLHFSYPAIVPVFDKQVLKAVGEDGTGNHSYPVLRKYLPFAWELADRHSAHSGGGWRETPLRLIDMALWVNRGVT